VLRLHPTQFAVISCALAPGYREARVPCRAGSPGQAHVTLRRASYTLTASRLPSDFLVQAQPTRTTPRRSYPTPNRRTLWALPEPCRHAQVAAHRHYKLAPGQQPIGIVIRTSR